ncbi:MAG: hypothetical protein P8Z79_00690 [Sedimentisphaerales bacterium]|jgi:hypothetical protein
MAKEHERRLESENRADTVYYDKHGDEIARISFNDSEYEQDGADIRKTTSENVECGDGSLTSLRQIMQGTMLFAVCDVCKEQSQRSWWRRRSATVPFSPADKVHRCFTCRAAICGRHSYSSKVDKHIRCRRCDFYFRLKRFLVDKIIRPLFFIKVRRSSLLDFWD